MILIKLTKGIEVHRYNDQRFYKVKGKVIRENGKPLSGVRISSTDNP
jgi:hypothetical protein